MTIYRNEEVFVPNRITFGEGFIMRRKGRSSRAAMGIIVIIVMFICVLILVKTEKLSSRSKRACRVGIGYSGLVLSEEGNSACSLVV